LKAESTSRSCAATATAREPVVSRAAGSIGRMLIKLSRIDVLLFDHFAMAPLKATGCNAAQIAAVCSTRAR
jgi:hypothetical protein